MLYDCHCNHFSGLLLLLIIVEAVVHFCILLMATAVAVVCILPFEVNGQWLSVCHFGSSHFLDYSVLSQHFLETSLLC